MPDEKPVTQLEPGASDTSKSAPNPEGEKGSTAELEKQIRNNLRKEYEKKAREEVDAAKKDIDKSVEQRVNQRIDELENKRRLSSGEEDELDKLNFIKKHPDSRAWKLFMSEVVEERMNALQKSQAKEDYDDALDMVKEYADDNDLDLSDFKEEINELIPVVRSKTESSKPTKLIKLAIKEWKKQQETKKMLKEAEDIKKQQKQFAESGGRLARTPTVGEDVKKAKESGDWSAALSRSLGPIK